MDRCRCEDYARAVDKLRFYTLGTLRPDIIDKYDRSEYVTPWVRQGVNYYDMKFTKPKAFKVQSGELVDQRAPEIRKIEKMWCPYMTPIKK